MKRVRFPRNFIRLAIIALAGLGAVAALLSKSTAQQQTPRPPLSWIEAGAGGVLPAEHYYENAHGKLGVLNTSGPTEMKGHPFFEPLGILRVVA
jgi:hypothetical protein